MTPALSIIIPTRDRSAYLGHAIRACTANPESSLEILVLDNASVDGTREVVERIADHRVRYVRSDVRLSMRDNFEKGIATSRGDVLLFIGDDDGVFSFTVAAALDLFHRMKVSAVSAARAHYFWPDIVTARRNAGLLPRGEGAAVRDARAVLRRVLTDGDYYRLPCLYHGFVKRDLVDRVLRRQGRFFLSSQVDMFSAIALSMEGIDYAFSEAPLVINGGSSRSNGASHFGGGTDTEKGLWRREDDLGFLPGFADSLTVGSLVVESALRYAAHNPPSTLGDILDVGDVEVTLAIEAARRTAAGRSQAEIDQLFATAGIGERTEPARGARRRPNRVSRLVRSFLKTRPIDLGRQSISNVYDAARYMQGLRSERRVGLLSDPIGQAKAAVRVARG